MASLNDIPDYILTSARKPDFQEWVSGLAVPLHTKRELCSFWQQFTGDSLGADFWTSLSSNQVNQYDL